MNYFAVVVMTHGSVFNRKVKAVDEADAILKVQNELFCDGRIVRVKWIGKAK